MRLLYKTKIANAYGKHLLLESNDDNTFYGFRYEGDSLVWGYPVNDCGTITEVISRLKRLLILSQHSIYKYAFEKWDAMLKDETNYYDMHKELLDYMQTMEV